MPLTIAATGLALVCACQPDSHPETLPTIGPPSSTDAERTEIDATSDSSATRVDADLSDYRGRIPAARSAARAYRLSDRSVLPAGPVARARAGDIVLENDRAQFVVSTDDASMSPCPYGGNPVDARGKSPPARLDRDILGEICPMLNVGRSFIPRRVEILDDGRHSGTAVVAAIGESAVLDFLNLRSLIPGSASGLLDRLAFDPGEPLPLSVTVYYLLGHGETGLDVVTALRNDGDETIHALFGYLVKSGGPGAFFNPLNDRGGFGYSPPDGGNLRGRPVPFLAGRSPRASYAVVPDPVPRLGGRLPAGGAQVTVAGAAAITIGQQDITRPLTAEREQFEKMDGVLHLAPGSSTAHHYRLQVGSGSLASVVDPAYESIGVQTGRITGRVVDTGGRPVPNARVTAVGLEDGRGFNQAVTDADGRYSMRTPDGTWRVSARTPARSPVRTVRAEVEPGTTTRTTVTTNRPARLTVAATTPEGRKVPARVSIACVNGCPNPATAAERDVGGESLPGGFEAIEPTALDGRLRRRLPPGTYRVSVSRGPEWSVWPGDAPATRGRRVQLSPGESVSLEAEIARVVDTPGALASDFHVHGVRSADSNVGRADRVMQFVSDGVEVIVGTDHDVVTDYRPVISDLGAEQWIEGIPGDEITTSDTGHFNGFPIPQDPSHRAGGALDWGRGPRPNMPPPAIYDWIQSFPGEQVVQMNHPVTPAIGTITGLEADVLRGTSHADPDRFRLPPPTGDNGRGWWSDDFTAIELMNGARVGRFWATARWWLTMIGRGFSPTGTAVTDTHTLYGHLGGVPRTYVQVPESSDEPDELDTSAFVASVNDGRAIGTNGPFVRWSLHESGRRAGLSGTLRIRDGDVSAEVRIETPTWMRVERVDFFSNVPGVVTEPGEVVETPLDPTASISLDRSASNLETTARGDRPHRRVVHEVRTELDVTADAYVVAVVRGRGEMRPVVTTRGASPFAFTNPIFVDANGGGYDDPPLEDRAAHEGASSSRSTDSLHGEPPNRAHGHVGRRRPPTREAIERLLRRPPD